MKARTRKQTDPLVRVESTDLLACFCGGAAMVTSHEEAFRSPTYYTTHSVRCSECSMHLSGQYLSADKAATTWNNLMHDSRTYRNRRANAKEHPTEEAKIKL